MVEDIIKKMLRKPLPFKRVARGEIGGKMIWVSLQRSSVFPCWYVLAGVTLELDRGHGKSFFRKKSAERYFEHLVEIYDLKEEKAQEPHGYHDKKGRWHEAEVKARG